MTKIIAITAAAMFVVGTAFAGGTADCTKNAANETHAACSVSLASLNLTADQKTKMDTLMAEHHKEGCSEASEAKYMEQAKSILTADQYTKFEKECCGGKEHKHKTTT